MNRRRPCARRIKYRSIASVTSKSLITPSFSGRIAEIDPGVLPSISLATKPTACPFCRTRLVPFFTATTLGSFSTIPSPLMQTSVLHVPRSMPMSTLNMPRSESKITLTLLALMPVVTTAECGCLYVPTRPCGSAPSCLYTLCTHRYNAPSQHAIAARPDFFALSDRHRACSDRHRLRRHQPQGRPDGDCQNLRISVLRPDRIQLRRQRPISRPDPARRSRRPL